MSCLLGLKYGFIKEKIMKIKKILFVTRNENKLREAREILGSSFMVDSVDLDLFEIQAIDGQKVVESKIKEAYQKIGQPLIVEDNQLYFKAWNGLPGALIHWFLEAVGCEGICKMMQDEKDRRAEAVVVIGYHNGTETEFFKGVIDGTVSMEPMGEFKFGWDPIFIPKGSKKSFAQMSRKEKNMVSMRRMALELLKTRLT